MKFIFKAILCLALCGSSLSGQAQLNRDPKTVQFVTSDIDNFWRAYDLAKGETEKAKRVAIFQTEYLDKGSPGLKDFLKLRIGSAESLVARMDAMPKFYATIRTPTLQVKNMETRMRAAFVKFKKIYPDAVFPNVYFLIGITNSGGTTGESGLLIGTEMYGKTKEVPQEELAGWLRSVLSTVDQLPGIVAHESCHYNQNLAPQKTLLGKSIGEGSCDFIGETISGQNINERLKQYGRTYEADLWRDFRAEMNAPDYSKWIYNGSTSKDRPGDLGYLMGYLIAKEYHRRAKDKRQAVRDILNVKDYPAFLAASGADPTTSVTKSQ